MTQPQFSPYTCTLQPHDWALVKGDRGWRGEVQWTGGEADEVVLLRLHDVPAGAFLGGFGLYLRRELVKVDGPQGEISHG